MSKGMMNVNDLHRIFGRNIKFHRTLKKWSQEELAEKLGISKNTICEVETGRKFVRAEKLVQFASIFNTDVYKLFMPEEVFQNDAVGVLAKFSNEVKETMSDLVLEYSRKIKK